MRLDGSGVPDVSGRVIEVDRPRRLVFGFDDPDRFDDPTFEPSVVTFDIEPGRDIVKLTVTHASLATVVTALGCRTAFGLSRWVRCC